MAAPSAKRTGEPDMPPWMGWVTSAIHKERPRLVTRQENHSPSKDSIHAMLPAVAGPGIDEP
jgi:hypothetical protein